MNGLAKRFGMLALLLALTGCASTHNPRDPLEGFNRAMFGFNDTIDRVALKPAAKAYQSVLPSFAQTAVGNFFGNLGDVSTALNDLLQGKVTDGLTDVMRVGINTTLGLGGLIDIGSKAGMTKHREDFGQTLGRWGVGSGPYVVLPFLGSSTVRDTVALPVDYTTDPWSYKYPVRWRNTGSVVRVIDERAVVLDASNLIEEAALDRYEFVRDAYLQRRESKIHDGENSRPAPAEDAAPKPKDSSSMNQSPASEPEPALTLASGLASRKIVELNSDPGNVNVDTTIGFAVPNE